jgi:hypothetical protein
MGTLFYLCNFSIKVKLLKMKFFKMIELDISVSTDAK